MTTTLPAASHAVNPQPGFYAVIPATVRYCKSLPPAAKLLFGEITALCSVEGFCWASNAYFCDLYGVNRSTLQRWLSSLSKAGFIRIELIPGTGDRRIYDLTLRPPTPPQKRGQGAAKTPLPRRKNAAQSITLINTESITSDARGPKFVGPGPAPARELRRQEDAAAPDQELKKSVRQVERAVAACRDLSARERFGKIWEVVNSAGCPELWQDGLDAVKLAVVPSTGILEPPTARFVAAVVSGLASRGLPLSVGL